MTSLTVVPDDTGTPCPECADHPGITSNPARRGMPCGTCSGSGELYASTQLVPPVIVHLPASVADFGAVDLLVQHFPWGTEVAIRPAGIGAWTPATLAGIDVEERTA